ncbi:ABC transporter permease [Gemella cuniculi]|uniref:ABC transporter permease n=1 Tax=Gemella cuniculi TaxID=150240 RepID=UPI000405E76B|nr:ABC transporter permease [Gemella cuniculi]
MSIFKKALLYITRKKLKTIIIFFILVSMSTMVLSTISIKKSTDNLAKETFKNITSSFSMEINRRTNPGTPRGAGNIVGKDIEQVKNIPGIKKYIKRMSVSADLVDLEPLKLANHRLEEQNSENKKRFSKTVIVTGTNDSSLDDRFSAETLKLVQGRHLQESDSNSVLVHEDFAKKNNLKLGDKIKLKGNPHDADNEKKSERETEVTVVGMFTGKNKGNTTSHMELYDNIFITDTTTTKTLYDYEDGKEIYQDAIFLVDGKDNLDKVITEAKKLPINWRLFNLVKSNQNFPVLQKSLDSIYGITNGVFVGTLIFSVITLSLILFLWINGRRKEIGVNLALGVSKAKIIGQYVVELVLISIPSFVVSYFLGRAISQSIGNQILSQSIKTVSKSVANETKGVMYGANAEVEGASKMITSIDVSVNPADMASVVGIGLAIIIVAICIASIRLAYKKPKELLSNIN